jgi:hypothetical protein
MAKSHRKHGSRKLSRKVRSRTRRYKARGGALGSTYAVGGPITPGAPIGNTSEIVASSSCLAAPRPGMISLSSVGPGGLPGMVGGRYTADLTPVGNGAALGMGAPAGAQAIPCEASTANPNPTPMMGGNGTAAYYAPTAAYTHAPSAWVGSAGAPVLLNIPVNPNALNPACVKTGGGKRKGKKRSIKKRRT